MAAAAAKKESTSLSLLLWKCMVLKWKRSSLPWPRNLGQKESGLVNGPQRQKEAWRRHIREVQAWWQVRGLAGAVLCDTRDLGMKLLQWHTLILEGQVKVEMRYVCPKVVKKMLLKQARTGHWKKWAAEHESEELREGVWFDPGERNE